MRTRSLWVTLLALAALALPAAPASALRADVLVARWQGQVSPPLDIVPAAHVFTMTGTVTVVGTDGVGVPYPCAFSGTGAADSLSEGAGFFAGACGPIALPACAYLRAYAVFTMQCTAGIDILIGPLVFEPVSVTFPISSFGLTGVLAYASAP